MNIFFDLDGTLIDSRLRLYRLFCNLTNQTLLSFEEYWKLKRNMSDHRKILSEYFNYTDDKIDTFQKEWLNLIETEEYLSIDKLFDFTKNVLDNLTVKNFNLYIVTARQSKLMAYKQLLAIGIFDYFKAILVTENKKSKAQLILDTVNNLNENDILIGDTGLDIKTAKELNIKSMAVLSGFRNRTILQNYNPDYIENNIQKVMKYV